MIKLNISKQNVKKYIEIVTSDFFLVSFAMFFALTREFLTYNLRLPGFIQYFLDFLLVILTIKIGIKIIKDFKNKSIKKIDISIIILTVFTIIAISSMVINGAGVRRFIKSYYLDYCRYFILLISMYRLSITREQINKLIKWIVIFVLVQFPIVLIQSKTVEVYEVSKYVIRDYYSGLLGYKSTAELGFLSILVISYSYGLLINKKLSLKKFLLITIYLLAMALFIEIKIVILLVPAAVVGISIFFIKDKRVIYSLIGILIVSILSMNIVTKIYPQFGEVFNIESMVETAGYTYADSGMSRLSGVPKALRFIDNERETLLIGKGPGSGTKYYNGKYHFRTFHFPYLISEYGVLGFISLMSMYLYILILSIKTIIKRINNNIPLAAMGIALVGIIIFSGIYSMSMMKNSFAVVAWIIMGAIIKFNKDDKS